MHVLHQVKGCKLSDSECAKTWQQFKETRSTEARNTLIEHYLGLVHFQALQVGLKLPEAQDINDLVSPGVIGLMQALETFDPGKGFQFETYCVPRIRGAMLDEIRKTDWATRLVRERQRAVNAMRERLRTTLQREGSDEEVSETLCARGLDGPKLLSEARVPERMCLDDALYEIADPNQKHPGTALEAKDVFRVLCKGLSKKERLALIMYYHGNMNMKIIGGELGLSESRVSQMLKRISQRLWERHGNQDTPEFFTETHSGSREDEDDHYFNVMVGKIIRALSGKGNDKATSASESLASPCRDEALPAQPQSHPSAGKSLG